MPAHKTSVGKGLISGAIKVVDLASIMRIITLITIPFKHWTAFKTGVIDKDGKTLKKRRDRKTREEKEGKEERRKEVDVRRRVILIRRNQREYRRYIRGEMKGQRKKEI